MNASITSAPETIVSGNVPADTNASTTFAFCGKGLHYDWRAIVSAFAASDLDAELAQLSDAPSHV